MRAYFEKMDTIGKALTPKFVEGSADSVMRIREVEKILAAEVERVKSAGRPAADLNKEGQLTAWQRLDYLVDKGTFCPLHTLYDPKANEEGTTGVIDGLGKINGRWA
ncbi:MAG: carboxyl transferase domain-containing protein, partial [Deltaproteobacteria bacterium]|nr:carboxyl transferase domain-containing protein [Deltaproteobacteria bacterium]